MELKLSNVLNNLPEFFQNCYLENESTDQNNFGDIMEKYYDICSNTVDGLFHIEEQKEYCIEFFDFVLNNFERFELIFNYNDIERKAIETKLKNPEDYKLIYNKLMDIYGLVLNVKQPVIVAKKQSNVEKALEQLLIDQPIEFSKCYIPTDVPKDTPQRIKLEILTQEKTPVFLMNKIYDLIGIQFEIEVLPTSKGGWSIWIEEKELGVDERRELAQQIKEFVDKNSYLNCDTDISDLDISETLEFSTRVNGDVSSEMYSDIDLQEAYLLRKKLLDNFFPKLKMENIEIYPVDEWVMMSINFNVIKENIKIFGEYNNKQYDLSDAIDLVNGNNYSSSEDFSSLTGKLAQLKDKKPKEWGYALTNKFAPKTGGLTEILNKIIEEISLN